jgi:hypothetical protein
MKGIVKKLKDRFDVAEIQMRIFVEQEKHWAKSWPSVLRKLTRDFPHGFVEDEINAYFQEGLIPDDPRIFDLCCQMQHWRSLRDANDPPKEVRQRKRSRAAMAKIMRGI